MCDETAYIHTITWHYMLCSNNNINANNFRWTKNIKNFRCKPPFFSSYRFCYARGGCLVCVLVILRMYVWVSAGNFCKQFSRYATRRWMRWMEKKCLLNIWWLTQRNAHTHAKRGKIHKHMFKIDFFFSSFSNLLRPTMLLMSLILLLKIICNFSSHQILTKNVLDVV